MQSEQSLKDGNLDQALAELQDQVRKSPANAQYRVYLFQLLSVLGQWERALTQLNVAGDMDASTLAMAQTYRSGLQAEVLRVDIFNGTRTPLVFGQPQPWVALCIEALRVAGQGKFKESQTLRDRAFEEAPATSGTIDDQPFEWIADADPRLGPILEAVVLGKYYWIPFSNIKRITLEPPADLRDMVWAPAYFEWANGGEGVGLIPTRYVGSSEDSRPEVRLSRLTDWEDAGGGVMVGRGQRLFATDAGEYSILDTRLITLDTAIPEASDVPSEGSDG